ncbi:MAG: acyloxyacyl hydrolase [Burkholderiales bacterium]|nr:acyloxyacyl hydrolase [Burkholderiales bacterium]
MPYTSNHQGPARALFGFVALLSLLGCTPAAAQAAGATDAPAAPRWGLYLQTAKTSHHIDAWTLGATLDWQDWRRSLWGAEVRGYWDFYASRWSARGIGGDFGTTVLGVSPSFRFTPDDGHSRWFVDAGVGATLANPRFVTPERKFSTRFNFASHLGVGVELGEQRQHALQLRLEHVSNAGIKKPNPGANFIQLRYTLHF